MKKKLLFENLHKALKISSSKIESLVKKFSSLGKSAKNFNVSKIESSGENFPDVYHTKSHHHGVKFLAKKGGDLARDR